MPISGPKLRYIGSEAVNLKNIQFTALPPVQVPATTIAATIEIVIGQIDTNAPSLALESVTLIPSAAVTGDAAHYATFAVNARTGTASPRILASFATSATPANDLAAFVAKALTIDGTKALLPGDFLTVSIAKTGNGVVTPTCAIDIQFAQ